MNCYYFLSKNQRKDLRINLQNLLFVMFNYHKDKRERARERVGRAGVAYVGSRKHNDKVSADSMSKDKHYISVC